MPKRYNRNKDMDKYIRSLLTRGWVYISDNKHHKLEAPSGALVIFPTSTRPGVYSRALQNIKARVKRAEGGYDA